MQELSVDRFRACFPEFQDEDAYPSSVIEFRLSMASNLCGRQRWGDLWETGCFLYVAHFLASYGASRSGKQNALSSTGVIASKSADGLSVSFDHSQGTEQGAGVYNTTVYGREYSRLRKMFGIGAVLV